MPLPPDESRLFAALSDYLEVVGQGGSSSTQAAWKEKLRNTMLTLDSLEAELASRMDPRLRHFFESKSYRKAHDHLASRASSGLANPSAARQPCSQ